MEGALPVVRDAVEEGKAFGRACDAKVAGSCANLVALVKRDGEECFPAFVQCRRRGELLSAGVAVLCGRWGAQRPGAERGAVPAGVRVRVGARVRRSWGTVQAGQGVQRTAQAIEYFERACRAGIAASCYAVGGMYRADNDEALAGKRLRQACDLSVRAATDNAAYFRVGAGQTDAALPFCGQ